MRNDQDRAGGLATPGDAVNRPELERLEAQRKSPQIQRTLTPGLGGSQAVNAGEQQRREERIRDIRDRLDAASGRATRDFALGQARHRATRDFERSR